MRREKTKSNRSSISEMHFWIRINDIQVDFAQYRQFVGFFTFQCTDMQ